ncbi:enoyl-CoA hydratase/isomerase family protein [Caenimonas sp. SL110]|uniref:enoyl-CoA hydratase/isomerase family protein n=1 Tax=Caenimonas sp. SL110 TaxID=1450524 RepID=UPI000652DE35|nr:enoyl-CoA hydratase-related protein [Caenimonas sp. SL110]
MIEYETILCEMPQADSGIATITLNRPASLNALSRRMADELTDALGQLSADASVRVLVLRGAGHAFCSGGDVRDMAGAGPRSADESLQGMERYRRMTLALHEFRQPVIAAVDGVAFGAGMSIALLADLVLLSDRARLCMVFQRVGLIPDCGALYTLPRLVGLQQAKALALTAREINACEAHAMGLALEVVPWQQLHARALQLAQSIAKGSPIALSLTKQALDASLQSDLSTMLALEAAGQAVALTSPQHHLAAQAFVRK